MANIFVDNLCKFFIVDKDRRILNFTEICFQGK